MICSVVVVVVVCLLFDCLLFDCMLFDCLLFDSVTLIFDHLKYCNNISSGSLLKMDRGAGSKFQRRA